MPKMKSDYSMTTERAILMFAMMKKYFSPYKEINDRELAENLGITRQGICNIRKGKLHAGASAQLAVLICTGWTYKEFLERMRQHGMLSKVPLCEAAKQAK